MFKNYYLFKKQIEQIQNQVIGSLIISIFTVNKNELIFNLRNNESSFLLKINLNLHKPFVLVENHKNFKSAKLTFFEQLYGRNISNIQIITYNRFIEISLENMKIYVKFYGSNPNIILIDNKGSIIESFKTLQTAFEKPKAKTFTASQDLIKNTLKEKPNIILDDLIKHICPAYNHRMKNELRLRMNMKGIQKVKDISHLQSVVETISTFNSEIDNGQCYVYSLNNQIKYITLYESTLLKKQGYTFELFSDINKAWSIFIYETETNQTYSIIYNRINKALLKRKKVLETALAKIADAENIERRKQIADLKGNLILTNKHKIPRGASEVELVNIFSEEQEKVYIKLNPKKKASENATHYFQKYKDIAEKKKVLKLKRNTYSTELNEIMTMVKKLDSAKLKELLKLQEKLTAMGVLQEHALKKDTVESLKYAFRRLILDNMWDIYVGKNNINNDLLTFTFANKWDVWLHAQGVSGSHVLIKVPGKDVTVPPSIIEQAAQIAAAHSKAKHSATVPVIYTQAKYVNRIRKAQPGTVTVRNEKTIFVKPLSLNI